MLSLSGIVHKIVQFQHVNEHLSGREAGEDADAIETHLFKFVKISDLSAVSLEQPVDLIGVRMLNKLAFLFNAIFLSCFGCGCLGCGWCWAA